MLFFYWRSRKYELPEISTPKSSMGSYFQQKILQKRSFFEFEAVMGLWGGPQQRHESRQHFGGHVA